MTSHLIPKQKEKKRYPVEVPPAETKTVKFADTCTCWCSSNHEKKGVWLLTKAYFAHLYVEIFHGGQQSAWTQSSSTRSH